MHVCIVQSIYWRKSVERYKRRLQVPSYLSRADHNWKIRNGIQRTDIGKYSFVNRSIAYWNQLPKGAIGIAHGNAHKFKTRIRKMYAGEGKGRC